MRIKLSDEEYARRNVIWQREYRQRSKEKRLEYQRQYRAKNPDAHKKLSNDWYVHNLERAREISRTSSTKCFLAKSLGCSTNEVPSDLLDAKVAVLNVTRKVKELMK